MRTRVLPMIAGALALAVALLLGLAQAAHATTIGWGSQATISAPGTSSSVKLAVRQMAQWSSLFGRN